MLLITNALSLRSINELVAIRMIVGKSLVGHFLCVVDRIQNDPSSANKWLGTWVGSIITVEFISLITQCNL